MKKRLISVLLCLAMVCSMLPVNVLADGSATPAPCKHVSEGWTAVSDASQLGTSGKYYLTQSIQLTGTKTLDQASQELSICLNGFSITAKSGARAFRVSNGAVLNIYDCNTAGTGSITGGGGTQGGAVCVVQEGTAKGGVFNLYSGKLTGNTTTSTGGAVRVTGNDTTLALDQWATFNMFGGSISNNTNTGSASSSGGGGVSLGKAVFNMSGGKIENNHADSAAGGGVLAGGYSVVNITGGEITGNQAKNGGGITVQGVNPAVLLKDVTITGNTGTSNAGGVYVGYDTSSTTNAVTVSGAVNITNNYGGANRIQANVQLMNTSMVIHQQALSETARIAVRKNNGEAVVDSGATAQTLQCYVSDSPAKVYQKNGDKLSLITKPTGASEHADTASYVACGHKGAEAGDQVTYTPWYSADSLPTESGNYYLAVNVTLLETTDAAGLAIASGKQITICLNGHNITRAGTGRLLKIGNGATLTVCDCTAHYEGEVYKAGQITGGNVSGNSGEASYGGAVYVEQTGSAKGGVFNLYDGQIAGNRAKDGGAVRVVGASNVTAANHAVFNMYGGSINNNTATTRYGGGVNVQRGTFIMTGGEITQNHADSNAGGGVLVEAGANVQLLGGKIYNNTAKNGGGICVQGSAPSLLLKDITITGNTATSNAGGIYVGSADAVTVSGAANITGNTLNGNASNVVIVRDRAVKQQNLDTTAQIGISTLLPTSGEVVASGITAETVGCYVPDESAKVTQLNGGKLYLLAKPANATEHNNPASYTACGHKGASQQATYAAWNYTDRLPQEGGYWYLTSDITLPSSTSAVGIYYDSGAKVTICLNGHNITREGTGRFFRISNGTEVVLCDCTAHYEGETYKAGRISGGQHNEGAVAWIRKFSTDAAAGVFTMYDGILTGNTSAGGNSAAGIISIVNGNFNLHGGAITGNNSPDAMVSVWGNDAKLDMKGGSIGGAILAADGMTVVTGNTGRGVLVNMAGGRVDMTGGAIMNNSCAGNAGGILINAGQVTLGSNAKVTGNSAVAGGGVRVQSGAQLILNGGEISGNSATGGDGGGVQVYGTLTVNSGNIKNNTASASGGGVVIGGGGTANILGGNITENQAKNGAGVMVQGENPQVLLKDVTITGNTATNNAGGVYVGYDAAKTTGKAVTISGKLNITGNTAGEKQANLYLVSEDRVIYQDQLDPAAKIGVKKAAGTEVVRSIGTQDTLSCFVSDVRGRIFELQGEAVHLAVAPEAVHTAHAQDECGHENVQWQEWADDSKLPSADGHYYLITDVTLRGAWDVKNNKDITLCLNGHTVKQEKEGHRVIRVEDSTLNLCDCQQTGKITGGNTSESAGAGAIMVTGKSTLRLYSGTITGNKTGGSGTIVVNADATFEMHGGAISGNENTASAGGVYVAGKFTMTGGAISGNKVGGKGGGVYIAGGTMTMTGGEVSGNSAVSHGGISNLGGTLVMEGGAVKNNTVTAAAGGIGSENNAKKNAVASVIIKGGEVSGNKSVNDGAGVRIDSGIFEMTGGEISGNDAGEGSAGGLLLKSETATISGGKIIGNKAKNAAGVLVHTDLTMTGGEISGNVATGSGAGAYVIGTMTVTGGQITENTAADNGGGVHVAGTLEMTGGTISGNTAGGNAGGISVAKGSATIGGTAKITENTATAGGGIRIENGAQLTLNGGEISGNTTTTGDGGGVQVYGTFAMTGGEITGNTAVAAGGGVSVGSNGIGTITGGSITNNKAKNGGGMIVQGENPQVLLKDVTITGNTATANAGGVYVGYNIAYTTGKAVTISGKLNITGNTVGEKQANLCLLSEDRVIYQDQLDPAAKIGITKTSGVEVVRSAGTQETLQCFSSDMIGRIFVLKGEAVQLAAAPGAEHIPHAKDECGHEDVQWKEWADDSKLPSANGHYYLITDVTLRGAWDVKNNKDITLCLNGYTVTQEKEGHRVIRVEDSTLNLCDCQGNGKITGGNTSESAGAGAIMVTGKSTLRLYGGNITGNKTEGSGMIVVGTDASFEMHGGAISGNESGGAASGVHLGGTMTMTGGSITGNKAIVASGGISVGSGSIYITSGTSTSGKLTMLGGEVSGNSAVDREVTSDDNATQEKPGSTGNNNTANGTTGGSGSQKEEEKKQPAIAVIKGGKISGNTSVKNGAGIRIDSGKLEMTGGAITGNKSAGKGGGVFISGGEMTMTGGEISGNTAVSHGGISNYGGKLVMEGGAVKNNTVTAAAGGIGSESNAKKNQVATVIIKGGEISGNKSVNDGAGVRIDSGIFEMTGGEISGNDAGKGSAGGLLVAGEKAIIAGGKITGNKGANAAGVLAKGALTMTGGEVSGNIGTGNGAGIYAMGKTFDFSNGKIVNNTAGGRGAVFLSGCTMTMTGGEISGNSATSHGGISSLGGTLLLKNGVIKNNIARDSGGGGIGSQNNEKTELTASVVISGGEIIGNTSKSDGAGVRIDSGSFEMTGGEISGNDAGKGSAGGLLLRSEKATISGGKITGNKAANAAGILTHTPLTMTGGEVSGNISTGSGAGVYVRTATFEMLGGEISGNQAEGDCGGIYLVEATATIDGGKIIQNHAKKVAGGILATKGSKLVMKRGEVSENSSDTTCGGIMVQQQSSMELSGGTVKKNTTAGYGAGIYVNGCSLTMTGGEVTGNVAQKSGAGLYVASKGSLTIQGGSVSYNRATNQGGGMLIASDAVISGGTFAGNHAGKEGGGAYVTNAHVQMYGGNFDGNTTDYNGAGICVRGETGLFEMHDGIVQNNKCKEHGGGFLVQGNGKLIMRGGKVNNNYAPAYGGGIRAHNCPVEIYGGEISGNLAHGQGAGIFSNLSLIVKNCVISNNKITDEANYSTYGAGIRAHNESTLEIENTKFIGNTVEGRAGAVDVAYHVVAMIKDCEFIDNFATEKGGAFSVYREAELHLTNCVVKNNSTDGNGGAFSADPYGLVTMTGCTVEGNSAQSGGMGYMGTKCSASFTDCTITGNTATQKASVLYTNGSLFLVDTSITGNTDQKGGATIYLDGSDGDGESYLPGIYEFKGNVIIADNQGGELILANGAYISIHGDGLGDQAKVLVSLPDDNITRWITGPYNYEKSGQLYVLTKGETSLAEANTKEPDQTQDPQPTEPQSGNAAGGETVAIVGGAIVLVAMIGVFAVIAVKRAKKQKKENQNEEKV